MYITKDPERRKAMKNSIQKVLEGRTDNKILSKTAQFAFDKLLVEKGDDNTIRQALREELNQIVTKDLDIVVDSLLDLAHRYSESSDKPRGSRDSRSYSHSASPQSGRSRSRSRSHSRSHTRSRSRSRSRSYSRSHSRSRSYGRRRSGSRNDRRRYSRSRSRSNENRREQYRNRYRTYDNQKGGQYGNRVDSGPRGRGPMNNSYMIKEMMQQLIHLVSKPSDQKQDQASFSQLETEPAEPKENLENCIKVDHLVGKNRDVLTLSNYFKQFGTICGVRIVDSQSAIVQFSSPSEARQALQSNVPVFNDRLIEVHACSSDLLHAPTASLPADADSAAGKAAGNRGKQDEMDKKLSLIHQRQMQKIKELTFYRTQVAKLLKLLPLYVSLWERSSDESRAAQEDRIRDVAMKIFGFSRDLYGLIKCGIDKLEEKEKEKEKRGNGETEKPLEESGEAPNPSNASNPKEAGESSESSEMPDNGERAQTQLFALLDQVRDAVRSTAIFEEINAKANDLAKQVLDQTAQEIQIQQNAMRTTSRGRGRGGYRGRGGGYRGRGGRGAFRPRVDVSKYQLDFRPNVVYLKGLDGASEEDVRSALKNYVGVRSVAVTNNEATVVFEQHWQTKKPIQDGLNIRGKMITPELSNDLYVPPQPEQSATETN